MVFVEGKSILRTRRKGMALTNLTEMAVWNVCCRAMEMSAKT